VNDLNRLTNARVEPIFQSRQPGDIQNSHADIRKINRVLRCEEPVSWDAALRTTLEAYATAGGVSLRRWTSSAA
jgi:hypothetical protein